MFPTRGDLHVAPFTDEALYMEQFNKVRLKEFMIFKKIIWKCFFRVRHNFILFHLKNK